jgi:hypothetical protein
MFLNLSSVHGGHSLNLVGRGIELIYSLEGVPIGIILGDYALVYHFLVLLLLDALHK